MSEDKKINDIQQSPNPYSDYEDTRWKLLFVKTDAAIFDLLT